ncbi:MAG: YgfZ/GcvT domain-containing protein, partial [Chthoniobacterales bacterium]
QLLAAEHPLCDSECTEQLRIEGGIPRWGRELTDQIIPVEANLADETIDYAKGCYIGQEVISRMKISGQTNKRLCGLVSLEGKPLDDAMKIYAPDSGKEVGWVTSATHSERFGKEIALGFVKRGSNEPGTRLIARLVNDEESAAAVEVRPLPFITPL